MQVVVTLIHELTDMQRGGHESTQIKKTEIDRAAAKDFVFVLEIKVSL